MAFKVKKEVFAIFALLVVALMLTQTGLLGMGQAKTIVSTSNIVYDDGSQSFKVNLSVDQDERFAILNTDLQSKSGLTVDKDVYAEFSRPQPICSYELKPVTLGVNILGQTGVSAYLLKQGIETHTVNYDVSTFDNKSSKTQELASGSFNLNAQNPTVNVVDIDGKGSMTMRYLGNLSLGVNCPDAGSGILIPTKSGGLKLLDRITVEKYFETRFCKIDTSIWNLISCGELALNQFVNDAANLPAPTSFSKLSNQSTDVANGVFKGNLPYLSSNPQIQLEFDKDFVNAIVAVRNSGVPVVDSVALDSSNINYNQTTKMKVAVSNSGSQDNFEIIPYATSGFVSFDPISDQVFLASGSSDSFTFTLTGKSPSVGEVGVKVVAKGSGKQVTKTTPLRVNETPYQPICGDNKCEGLESVTCVADCKTTPEAKEICNNNIDDDQDGLVDENCKIDCPAGTTPQIKDEAEKLFGLIPIPFTKTTTTTCVPVIDPVILALIGGAVVIGFALVIRRRK